MSSFTAFTGASNTLGPPQTPSPSPQRVRTRQCNPYRAYVRVTATRLPPRQEAHDTYMSIYRRLTRRAADLRRTRDHLIITHNENPSAESLARVDRYRRRYRDAMIAVRRYELPTVVRN